ncbi:MAG: hypothetical protein H0V39_07590, partial [Nitrosomonas sp.]|nr:hypothetical protein [Nitrosomonas sp.]
VSQRDVSEAIEQLDNDVLQDIAIHLIDGDTEKAKEILASKTDLTEKQIEDIVKGLSKEVEGIENEAEDVQDRVKQQLASFIAGLDAPGGPQLSTKQVRSALEELDIDTLQSAAMQLIQGNTEGAKDILAARTNLTDAQIDDLVDGVNQQIEKTIAKYQEELNEATEAVATYTQAVLWAVFAASAIGLALSILGGSIGAATSKRLYMNSRQMII